jgi:hypothetical protein
MSVAQQLADALNEPLPKDPEPVRLGIGQFVEVRTHKGKLVVTGTIQALDPNTKTVRVVDRGSGSDLQVDVDPRMYDVWVRDVLVPGGAPAPSQQPALSVGGSTPGAFTLGKRHRIFP